VWLGCWVRRVSPYAGMFVPCGDKSENKSIAGTGLEVFSKGLIMHLEVQSFV
jgi:hypothetical protein